MVLITGASGQLGRALQKRLTEYYAPSHSALDITDPEAVGNFFSANKPDVVVNCAAYNFVDLAETNEEECFKVNAVGALNLARECLKFGSYMIHISSDYVFNGRKAGVYEANDKTDPLSVYGRSKAIGEQNVLNASGKNAVVRTSWLYSEMSNNFVSAIIKAGKTCGSINVVDDQKGSPTYASDLALVICEMIKSRPSGIFHATNEGFCTRAEFAEEILKEMSIDCTVNRVASSQYPSAAVRPENSCMSKASLANAGLPLLPEWKDALTRCIRNRKVL